MHLARAEPAHQIDSGGDVAPLVAAAHLERAVEPVEELEEVARLQQQIAELGVRDPVLALEPAVDRLLLQHVIHGEVLAGVAQEPEQIKRREPVGVVDDTRGIVGAIEIEEPLELTPDADDVGLDLLDGEQRPLLRLAARVSDHAGAAADDRDRGVTEPLQAGEAHHGEQRSGVQTVGRGIESDVRRDRAGVERVAQPLRVLRHHAAPRQLFEQTRCHGRVLYSAE